jgi:hypothetical protein
MDRQTDTSDYFFNLMCAAAVGRSNKTELPKLRNKKELPNASNSFVVGVDGLIYHGGQPQQSAPNQGT